MEMEAGGECSGGGGGGSGGRTSLGQLRQGVEGRHSVLRRTGPAKERGGKI